MAEGISFKTVGKILRQGITKGSIQAEVAKEVAKGTLESARSTSLDVFKFDFINLFIQILVIYAVAWFIEVYMKAKLFFADPVVQQSVLSGFFGIAGILFNFFAPKPETSPTKLTENKFVNDLFSEEGFKGFRYWDMINFLVGFIVIATYFRHRNQTGGNVEPATTVGFILILFAITIVEIPQLKKRLKVTDFNLESMR